MAALASRNSAPPAVPAPIPASSQLKPDEAVVTVVAAPPPSASVSVTRTQAPHGRAWDRAGAGTGAAAAADPHCHEGPFSRVFGTALSYWNHPTHSLTHSLTHSVHSTTLVRRHEQE